MMTETRRFYPKEFKDKAIELAVQRGNVAQAARELDMAPELLRKWVSRSRMKSQSEFSSTSLDESEHLTPQQQIHRLKQELEYTRMERDILKKAVSIFSKNEGKFSR